MAEYQALSQNTYKFVTERIFNHVGNISSNTSALSGKAKIIIDGVLSYLPIYPAGTYSSADSRVALQQYTNTTSSGGSNFAKAGLEAVQFPGQCQVDGKVYYGMKNAQYRVGGASLYAGTNGSDIRIPKIIFPGGILKVVKYSASQSSITVEEFNFSTVTGTEKTANPTSTKEAYGYYYAYIYIAKVANDVILGIEIEYPTYNIIFSGAGLQYSTDNGATFTDITSGLFLENVEHLMLKNADTISHNVGTTSSGTDIAVIAAGETVVAIPEADGTWYIS